MGFYIIFEFLIYTIFAVNRNIGTSVCGERNAANVFCRNEKCFLFKKKKYQDTFFHRLNSQRIMCRGFQFNLSVSHFSLIVDHGNVNTPIRKKTNKTVGIGYKGNNIIIILYTYIIFLLFMSWIRWTRLRQCNES